MSRERFRGVLPASLTAKDLLAWFEVKESVSQRAEAFLRANGVNPFDQYGSMNLEARDLLTSQRRQALIEHRDRWLQALDDE